MNLQDITGEVHCFIVSVEYSDYLSFTLPNNIDHLTKVTVVTTQSEVFPNIVCETGCNVFRTNSFYENGAKFNKWLALEQAIDNSGIKGSSSWVLFLDADILLPKKFSPFTTSQTNLFGMKRRMAPNSYVLPESEWHRLPLHRNFSEIPGYFQLFNASCPRLTTGDSWLELDWAHAGGGDSFFQNRWSKSQKVWLSDECLHIGEAGVNWAGRCTEGLNELHQQNQVVARQRLAWLREVKSKRKKNRTGLDPYGSEKIGGRED